MAENAQSQGQDNAENELESNEKTQDELKTLRNQTIIGEDKTSPPSNIGSESNSAEKSGNLSAAGIENSGNIDSNFPEKTAEVDKQGDNNGTNNDEENGPALKIRRETEGSTALNVVNEMDTKCGSVQYDGAPKYANNPINVQPDQQEDWDLETKHNPPKDFILKSEDAKEDNLDLAENFQNFQNDAGDQPSTLQESVPQDSCSQQSAIPSYALQDLSQSLYHIKWIWWKNINTPIITQNENGPCPLIALINALILRRKISIPPMQEIVSASQLMEYLGDCILDQAPERLTEGAQLNYEQNMADAIAIMSKLQTGLDVNVKFTGVADFEFTPECVVFDLLNIRLMHGWLVDPQNHEAVVAIGNLSYNQLVEKIIASKQDEADPDLVSAGLVAESFLEHSATQLTYHGLYELNTKLGEEELCIFFRNNHFNTLYKHKSELFLLVTDQGFLTEDKVMWETLCNVEGDGYFVDALFRTLPASHIPAAPVANTAAASAVSPTAGISQEDQDYLVALTLQEEQSKIASMDREAREHETVAAGGVTVPTQPDPSSGMTSQEWSDLQLALLLQKEEQQKQQQQQQQQLIRQQQHTRPGTATVTPRGSPSHAVNPPTANVQQQRPHTAPPTQRTHPNNNEKCTIL